MARTMAIISMSFLIGGCNAESWKSRYTSSIQSGICIVPHVYELCQLTDYHDNFITNWKVSDKPLKWTTRLWFEQGYELVVKAKVKVGDDGGVTVIAGSLSYILMEVSSFNISPSGVASARYSNGSRELLVEEVDILIESGGDLSAIGFTNRLTGFEELIIRARRDIVHVSLPDCGQIESSGPTR